jgi:hypothetical protein
MSSTHEPATDAIRAQQSLLDAYISQGPVLLHGDQDVFSRDDEVAIKCLRKNVHPRFVRALQDALEGGLLQLDSANEKKMRSHMPILHQLVKGQCISPCDIQYALEEFPVGNIDAVDPATGNTALHFAALKHRSMQCRILLKHGASRDAVNKAGKTAEDALRELVPAWVEAEDGVGDDCDKPYNPVMYSLLEMIKMFNEFDIQRDETISGYLDRAYREANEDVDRWLAGGELYDGQNDYEARVLAAKSAEADESFSAVAIEEEEEEEPGRVAAAKDDDDDDSERD